jgi:hypothetical protein
MVLHPLHDEASVAWEHMVRQLDYHTLATRGKTVIFENFTTALIVIGIIAGALIVSLCYYYCCTVAGLGARAWRGHTIYEGTELRHVYMETETGRQQALIAHPKFREEKRSSKTSWVHLVAIIGYWVIILFGFYSAFQVCGIDPAILIALGAGTLLFSYGLAPLISETRDAIRVFWGNRLHEGDDILVWAPHIKGRVKWMGSNYIELEQIDDAGNYLEHQIGYTTLLSPGFTRWVTGGAKQVMGKAYKDWLHLQNAMYPHTPNAPAAPSPAAKVNGSYLSQVMVGDHAKAH